MAKRQELRAVSTITIDGVKYIWDDLPEETRAELRERMLKRAGEQLSNSLSSRPEEAKRVLAAYNG